MPTENYIPIVSATIAFGSAVVSILALYFPWRNLREGEIFKEAVRAMERAYEALTDHGKSVSPPIASRINWLTAARHIGAYKSLRSKLKTDLYMTLCSENEEYWRHQFYLSLLLHPINTFAYFNTGEIEPRSAIVLFNFASWPKARLDPIDTLDIHALIQESGGLRINVGFKEYLKKFPKYEKYFNDA